jgi:Mitochondrial ribosomal protein L31
MQKARQRKRLKQVDNIVSIVDKALAKQGLTTKAVERWKDEMPTEAEMLPKDKYTIFDRKEKKYRKGIHSKFSSIYVTCGIWNMPENRWHQDRKDIC